MPHSTGASRPSRSSGRCARSIRCPAPASRIDGRPRRRCGRRSGSTAAALRAPCSRSPPTASTSPAATAPCACARSSPPGGKRMSAAAFAAGRRAGSPAALRSRPSAQCSTSSARPRSRCAGCSTGATLPAALAAVDDGAPTRGRAFVQELAYGTLRHWGRLAALLPQALAAKPLSEPLLTALVAVALYQLDHTTAPAFADRRPRRRRGRAPRSDRRRSRSSTRCSAAICASATR